MNKHRSLFFFMFFLMAFVALGWWIFSNKKHNINYQTFGYGFRSDRIARSKGEILNHGLLDHSGQFHELYRYSTSKALIISGQDTSCSNTLEKINTIKLLEEKFKGQSFKFFLLNSNPNNSRNDIVQFARDANITTPILLDRSQLLAENLGLDSSLEFVIIDPQNWRVLQRGETGKDLEKTLTDFPKNIAHTSKKDKVLACPIQFAEKNPISYNKQIVPLLKSKCLTCHSSEGPYLPVLDNHQKIKNWAEMAKETILAERMPPFSADTHFGTYLNDISLSPDEKRTLVRWFDQGAILDGYDTLKGYTPPKKKLTQYRLAKLKKAYTVEMDKEIVISPVGTIEYIYTQLGGAAPRDMWIKAVNVKTTNPRQLHHLAMMITKSPLARYEKIANFKRLRRPDDTEEKKIDGDIFPYVLNTLQGNEFLENPDYIRMQVWAAGRVQPHIINSERLYLFIPKGSYIVLESHHMGTGKEETEKTTVEFFEEINPLPLKERKKLKSKLLLSMDFIIPPYESNYQVLTKEWELKEDIEILSYTGHLHMRGKAVSVEYISPDGKEKRTIASIPNFYYGWHTGAGIHNLTPQMFKKGSKLRATCSYDNSAENPNNPDPTREVKFGQRVDRTEMCNIGLSYILK